MSRIVRRFFSAQVPKRNSVFGFVQSNRIPGEISPHLAKFRYCGGNGSQGGHYTCANNWPDHGWGGAYLAARLFRQRKAAFGIRLWIMAHETVLGTNCQSALSIAVRHFPAFFAVDRNFFRCYFRFILSWKRNRWRIGSAGGKSGLRRAGCWLTARGGDSMESATENIPPMVWYSRHRQG